MAENSAGFRRIGFHPRVLQRRRRSPIRRPRCSASRCRSRSCWRPPASPASPTPRASSPSPAAAARAGLPYTLSTLGTRSIEEVAEVSDGRKWFQLYMFRDRGLVRGDGEAGGGRGVSRRWCSPSTPPCTVVASATCGAASRCRRRSGSTRCSTAPSTRRGRGTSCAASRSASPTSPGEHVGVDGTDRGHARRLHRTRSSTRASRGTTPSGCARSGTARSW